MVLGVENRSNARYSHLNSQRFCQSQGVKSGVGFWPDKPYVFRAVLGCLVEQMKVCVGPGGWKPLEPEIFTPQFTPKWPVLGLFWPLLGCFGAFSGCLAPPDAYYEVLEHGAALRGRLDIVWALSRAIYFV